MSNQVSEPATDLTVTLLPGDGIVIRTTALICLARHFEGVAELIDDVCTVGPAVGRSSGQTRNQTIAAAKNVIAAAGEQVTVAVAATDSRGASLYLTGEVTAVIGGEEISPPPHGAVERSVDWPPEGLGLYLGDSDQSTGGHFRITAGVVPGGGVHVRSPLALAGTEAIDAVPARRPVRAAEPSRSPIPIVSDRLDDAGAVGPPRPPLPTAAPPERRKGRPQVRGHLCSRGHLNDPKAGICHACGIRMEQLTGVLVQGTRPPLGWLLLDNGSTLILDEDVVLGRDPLRASGSRGSSATPIAIDDSSGEMSRRHAEIRLVEWAVHLIDLGSANGTYVSGPMSEREIRLDGRPYVLQAGCQVRVGGRTFIFESPHARI